MNSINNFIAIIDEAEQTIKNILINRIKEIPNNPNINRLSNLAYTIKFSQLGNNWTAFYHDWEAQKKYIIDLIQSSNIKQLKNKIDFILEHERTIIQSEHQSFHPDFIKQIKPIFY